jgi:hypothetical protein
MRKIAMFAAAAAMLLPGHLLAADVGTPIVKAPVLNPCTLQNCSGWYAGIGLSGDATNANVIGNGINGSVFAAGMGLDIHGGYQLWNGTYFAAVEAGVGNQFQPTQSIGSLGSSIEGYEKVKLGMALSGLLGFSGLAPTAPSQSPTTLNIPATLLGALISPYVQVGAQQRHGISQLISGVGNEFLIASHWNLDVGYTYAPAVNTLPSENKVKLDLNYHF